MATVNGFRGVPWFVGGGAEHSPEVARNMLAIASQRTQGITGTSDLKVTQGDVPGQFVQVGIGSALIRQGQTPVSQQTYSAYAPTVSRVDIVPTGSSSGRSDLVIVRVEDSSASGSPWQAPADIVNGPYVKPIVIQGVAPGTTTLAQANRGGDTAIVLARIDIPASTGTITNGMIVDLRRMAAPRQETQTNILIAPLDPTTLTSATFTNWISQYNPGNIVPEWATHAQTRFWLGGIYTPGPCDGLIRSELWAENFVNAFTGPAQAFDQDVPVAEYGPSPSQSTGGGAMRFSLSGGAFGTVYQYRGQYAYHRIGAQILNRSDRSFITVDGKSSLMFDITFYEKPI